MKRDWIMRGLILSSALIVAGCATKWMKPGATAEEFEVMKAQCTARSFSRFQPVMQQIQIGTGYTTPLQTQCYGNGYSANCTSTGGQYIPPSVLTVDANNNVRGQDIRACFFENGWTPESDRQQAQTTIQHSTSSDFDARMAASNACLRLGIKADDGRYPKCFAEHFTRR